MATYTEHLQSTELVEIQAEVAPGESPAKVARAAAPEGFRVEWVRRDPELMPDV